MLKIISLILLSVNLGTNEETLVEDYLRQNLKNYSSFEYEIVSQPGISDSQFSIDESRNLKLKNQYVYIPVKIASKNYNSRSYITAKVKLFKKVFVANRRIAKGEKLSLEDFNITEMDVTNYRSPIENLNTDFSAKISMSEGTVLEKWMIKSVPLVYQSKMVNAFAQYGSVEVEFKVKAREEGSAGDIIRVVRDDRQMFSAEIIDSSTVKILE